MPLSADYAEQMTWPATERYDLAPAPDGLGIVQDLLNTRPSPRQRSDDLLGTVRAAQQWANTAIEAWAAAGGHRTRRVRLTTADVAQLRALRDQLAALVRSQDDQLPPILAGLTFVSGSSGTLEPGGTGWRFVAGAVFLEIHRARQVDQWRRMKTCRNAACPGAFYDRSPNNGGAWHDVRTCGNIANLRASRARRARPPA